MTHEQKLVAGLNVLSAYDELRIAVEHDIIYAGCSFAASREMTEATRSYLADLGWHDEGMDGWSFNV